MRKNREPDKKDEIELALESKKVDSRLRHEYSRAKRAVGFDPTTETASFLSLVKNESVKIKNMLVRIGNVVDVLTPWSEVPKVVEDDDVIYLQASR